MNRLGFYFFAVLLTAPYIFMLVYPDVFQLVIGTGQWIKSVMLLLLVLTMLIFSWEVNSNADGKSKYIFLLLILLLSMIVSGFFIWKNSIDMINYGFGLVACLVGVYYHLEKSADKSTVDNSE